MTRKLPTVGTSAAKTVFCSTEIDVGRGRSLFIDGNGKITRNQGDLEHPVPNAFSLPAQAVEDARMVGGPVDPSAYEGDVQDPVREHCPGSTPTCRKSCYVSGLAQHAAPTYQLYEHNARVIRELLADPEAADESAMAFAAHLSAHCESFRWHVSGDVFSPKYAAWIADVCRESPTVEHWIYTRSFAPEILRELVAVSTLYDGNLALNLSCDRDNYEAACEASNEFGRDYRDPDYVQPIRLCYLTSSGEVPPDLRASTDVIFPDYALRSGTEEGRAWFASLMPHQKKMTCPVDYVGKSEERRCGPCDRCLT